MNKKIFEQMREQLKPSEDAISKLHKRIRNEQNDREHNKIPRAKYISVWQKYVISAVCAVFIIVAVNSLFIYSGNQSAASISRENNQGNNSPEVLQEDQTKEQSTKILTEEQSSEIQTMEQSIPNTAGEDTVIMSAKIITINDDRHTLLANMDRPDSTELYNVDFNNVPITNNEGETIQLKDLKEGMLIDIVYNGMALESYPAIIFPQSVQVKEHVGDLVGLYLEVIQEIFNDDNGRNSDIELVALDLKKVVKLTESEKAALSLLVSNMYGFETIRSAFDALCEEGYIPEINFQKGVIITIEEIGENDSLTPSQEFSFNISISRWRSLLGAIGYDDCKAKLIGNDWTFEKGTPWIS